MYQNIFLEYSKFYFTFVLWIHLAIQKKTT